MAQRFSIRHDVVDPHEVLEEVGKGGLPRPIGPLGAIRAFWGLFGPIEVPRLLWERPDLARRC